MKILYALLLRSPEQLGFQSPAPAPPEGWTAIRVLGTGDSSTVTCIQKPGVSDLVALKTFESEADWKNECRILELVEELSFVVKQAPSVIFLVAVSDGLMVNQDLGAENKRLYLVPVCKKLEPFNANFVDQLHLIYNSIVQAKLVYTLLQSL